MTDNQRKLGLVVLLAVLLLRGGCDGVGISVGSGPRDVLLVYESADNSPAFARLVLDLRDGAAAKYLAEKKHALTIIDRDTPDPNGDRAKVLAKWQAELAETPVVLVIDKASGKLAGKSGFDRNGTSDAVLDIVKRYGG